MRIVGADRLQEFVTKHRDAESAINRCQQETTAADWESLIDVRRTFPAADGVEVRSQIVITVFNVRGNKYRLLTTIVYALRLVTVLEVLTHAEYDKGKWKTNY